MSARLGLRLLVLGSIVCLCSCATSANVITARLQDQFTRQKKLFGLCQGLNASPSDLDPPLTIVGFDEHASNRLRASLTYQAAGFDPINQVEKTVSEIHAECSRLASASIKKDIPLCNTVQELRKTIGAVRTDWQFASHIFNEFVTKVDASNALATTSRCADEQLMSGTTAAECAQRTLGNGLSAWAKASQLLARGAVLMGRLGQRQSDLAEHIRAIQQQVLDGKQKDSVDEELVRLTQRADFLNAQLLALGGQMRDGEGSIRRLAMLQSDPSTAVSQFVALLAHTQSDRLLDILLLWISGAVRDAEHAIKALDAESYGAASVLFNLGMESEASDRIFCHVGENVVAFVEEAGFSPASLGARVCNTANDDAIASPLLARIYFALATAASGSTCAEHWSKPTDSSEAVTSSGFINVPSFMARTSDSPMQRLHSQPSMLASDVHTLAAAVWDSRLLQARVVLATSSSPLDISEESMPRMQDTPRSSFAGFGLVERRERVLLRYLAQEDDERRFEFSNSALTQFSLVNNITITVPERSGSETASAMRQVAWELCEQNRRRESEVMAQALCGSLNYRDAKGASPNVYCQPIGYHVVLSPTPSQFKALVWPIPTATAPGDAWSAKLAIQAMAARIRLIRANQPTSLRFLGWASTHLPSTREACSILIPALLAEGLPTPTPTTTEHFCKSQKPVSQADVAAMAAVMGMGIPLTAFGTDIPGDSWVSKIITEAERRYPGQELERIGWAANAVLSVLRAMGAAKIATTAEPGLCVNQNACRIEAFGTDLAPEGDRAWQAFAIEVGGFSPSPACASLHSSQPRIGEKP